MTGSTHSPQATARASELVLHCCKAIGLFALARLLTRRGLRILCYHGFELADEGRFRPRLFVTMNDFAGRLDLLARRGYPVLPLSDALERLGNRTLPPGAVAITIDDGFYAVHKAAAPALLRHGFSATVYVPTYYVEKEVPIFRLVVRYLFALTPVRVIEVKDNAWLSGVVALETNEQRDHAAARVIDYGETQCDETGRQRVCRELAALLRMDYQQLFDSRVLSLMNASELRELGQFGVDVQLHTHRHRFPTDDKSGAQAEIHDNRRSLERVLGAGRFTHFCYPSGQYSVTQWPWLVELGIESATTCEVGLNYADTPRLGLKRFLDDSTISVIRFEAEMCGFLELARRLRALIRRARSEPRHHPAVHDAGQTARLHALPSSQESHSISGQAERS